MTHRFNVGDKQDDLNYIKKVFKLDPKSQEKLFNYKKFDIYNKFILISFLSAICSIPILGISAFFIPIHNHIKVICCTILGILVFDITLIALKSDEEYFFKDSNQLYFDSNGHRQEPLGYKLTEKLISKGIFFSNSWNKYYSQIISLYKIAYLCNKKQEANNIINSSIKLKYVISLMSKKDYPYIKQIQKDKLNEIYYQELENLTDHLYKLIKPDIKTIHKRAIKYHIYELLPNQTKQILANQNMQNKINKLTRGEIL